MKIFNNIKFVSFLKNETFVYYGDSKSFVNVLNDRKFTPKDLNGDIISNLFPLNNRLYFTLKEDKEYKSFNVDSTFSNIKHCSDGTLIKSSEENLFLSYYSEGIGYVKVLNSNNDVCWIKKREECWIKLITNSFIYCSNNNSENKILKNKLKSGEIDWEIENTKIYNGINDNPRFVTSIDGWVLKKESLFIPLRNGKILLINDNSGTVDKVIFSDNPNGQYGDYYHDLHQNKLVKLFRNTLHEVDLDTYEIEFYELPRLKTKDAEPNGGKWAQDDTYIYYCSFDGTTVNALNKKTKEIDWQHQHNQNADDIDIMNEIPVRYKSVQYHHGKLFVMDNRRSLHIFEEEDMPKKELVV